MLLEKKLAECRFSYEEELEFISKQFEDMQAENESHQEDKRKLNAKINYLEGIISQQQNMMETTGYMVTRWEEKKEPSNDDQAASIESF